MLRYLEGHVTEKHDDGICLSVQGFGFFVFCSKSVFSSVEEGQQLKIFTHLQVAENGFGLYGFKEEEERELFQLLLTVKGVGAKMAMSFLRHLDLGEIAEAIATSQAHLLATVPGVGKKTAERVCFELKQKIEKSASSSLRPMLGDRKITGTVLEALAGLGFSQGEAMRAVAGASRGEPAAAETEEALLQAALGQLQHRT
ncbi:MAG: Holliday junction branch migration protein RuvA [Thermovirgaceae bacterium]